MKTIKFKQTGSNEMSGKLAARSVREALCYMGIAHTMVNAYPFTITMTDQQFTLFLLQWNTHGRTHRQYTVIE